MTQQKIAASTRHGYLFLIAATLVLCVVGSSAGRAQDAAWFDHIIATSKSAAQSIAPRSEARALRSRQLVRVVRAQPEEQKSAPSERNSNSLTGNAITWQAASGCTPAALRSVLANVAGNFGPVTVTSTCRGRVQNRAAGGAGGSYHLSGEAVDFRVRGSIGAVYAYLNSKGNVGGLKHYGGGLFHIDTGPRRSW